MVKKFEKFWSGSANFSVTEDFTTIEAAYKQPLPSQAAKFKVNDDSVSFVFNRVKLKGGISTDDHSLSASRTSNREQGKREKVSERKDNETKK